MQFTGTYHVTINDVVHAGRLAARRRDTAFRIVGSLIMLAVLLMVGHAFIVYIRTVLQAPQTLLDLLRFKYPDAGIGINAWLSVIITVLLPIFLFHAARAFLEALWPSRRIRRLFKGSDSLGVTAYLVNQEGIRATTTGGPDVFMPWTSFDAVRRDSTMLVLQRKNQMRFFVPLAAFGAEQESVAAHITSNVDSSPGQSLAQSGSPTPAS